MALRAAGALCAEDIGATGTTTIFSRIYGEGLGAGGVRHMSFDEFAFATATATDGWRYYLAAPVLRTRQRVQADDLDTALPADLECYYDGAIGSELFTKIDWPWLAHVHPGVALETCQLWAGCGTGITPLHFDALNNVLCQIRGRKHVRLFAPSQSFHLLPFPVGHPKDNFAMVDISHPRAVERWPSIARAHGLCATLGQVTPLFPALLLALRRAER